MRWSSKLIAICYIVCAVASFSEVGAVTETAETFGIVQFGSSAVVNANKVPEPLDKLRGNAGVNAGVGVTEGVGVGAGVNLSGLGDVNNGNSAAVNVATVDPSATTTSSSKQADTQNAVKSGLRGLRPEI